MNTLAPGTLLLSDPFLKDPNFLRTAVLLCEHQADAGSIGFVINKLTEVTLEDVLTEAVGLNIPIFEGGPVQKDTLHFIHQQPQLIAGGKQIARNIYWGGDFTSVISLLQTGLLLPQDIRFFIGYSGWDKQQLPDELAEKSWILTSINQKILFQYDSSLLWKKVLYELGGPYQQMANYPIDPRLN